MWKNIVIEYMRVLIGDLDCLSTYEDTRLERVAVISAFQVLNEINTDTTYTVNILTGSLSPDPSTLDTPDNTFINLIALKSSYLIISGELRAAAMSNVSVVDGPSTISMAGRSQSLQKLASDLQSRYELAKFLYQSGQAGQAITTPSTVTSIYPIQDF